MWKYFMIFAIPFLKYVNYEINIFINNILKASKFYMSFTNNLQSKCKQQLRSN